MGRREACFNYGIHHLDNNHNEVNYNDKGYNGFKAFYNSKDKKSKRNVINCNISSIGQKDDRDKEHSHRALFIIEYGKDCCGINNGCKS